MRDFEQTALRQFLYFPTQAAAKRASVAAVRIGYQVERLQAAPGTNRWLLLLRDCVLKEDAYAIRLVQLAKQFGGEYDGYERQLEEIDCSKFKN